MKSSPFHVSFHQLRSPAKSPDLNPIEWMFADLKRYVRSKMCKTIEELKAAILEYRRTLTAEKCAKFINHLKRV
jgi:transposase